MQRILQTTDWQTAWNIHTWTEIHDISAYITATTRIPVNILTLSYTRLRMLSNQFLVGLLNKFLKFEFRNNSSVSFSDCDFSNFVFNALHKFMLSYSCAAPGLNVRAYCMRNGYDHARARARHATVYCLNGNGSFKLSYHLQVMK